MKLIGKVNTMKNINEFEIVVHGIEHSDYFQGCGVAFTKFNECYTGIGNNASEALEDALEQAEQSGYNTEGIKVDQPYVKETELTHTDCNDDECYSEGMYYFVSVRIK
jgi:hypothetical protein